VVSVACVAALAGVCAVVFAVHRSLEPQILHWSWRYLLGAVLPLLGVVAVQAVLALLPPLSGSRDYYLALGCLVAGGLLLGLGVGGLPLYELPVLAAFLGLMSFALAGYRVSHADPWLISFISLNLLCLLLFVPETVRLVAGGRAPGDHRLPIWGDEVTFRHLFPEAEPFISAGGRLQPNLDIELLLADPARSTYRLETNSLGFRNDREIPLAKEPGELRILNLGDSFSVGCGVDQDHFIGTLLESRWRQADPTRNVTVMNAEVSDPAYGLLYLQRFGVDFAPDVVVYSYVDNDSHQAYLRLRRGGSSRSAHSARCTRIPSDVTSRSSGAKKPNGSSRAMCTRTRAERGWSSTTPSASLGSDGSPACARGFASSP
jgi:hypothetical protein